MQRPHQPVQGEKTFEELRDRYDELALLLAGEGRCALELMSSLAEALGAELRLVEK